MNNSMFVLLEHFSSSVRMQSNDVPRHIIKVKQFVETELLITDIKKASLLMVFKKQHTVINRFTKFDATVFVHSVNENLRDGHTPLIARFYK